jgi:hypothetical protein
LTKKIINQFAAVAAYLNLKPEQTMYLFSGSQYNESPYRIDPVLERLTDFFDKKGRVSLKV